MPTYDYVCDGCGHKFELFQSINDPLARKCPKCKKLKLRRLFGIGAAVMFKGSGFYQTDYRSDSYKKAASADTAPSSDGGSSKGSDNKGSDSAAATPKSDNPASDRKKKPKSPDK
jgi:putative FmdB family regulatory protein